MSVGYAQEKTPQEIQVASDEAKEQLVSARIKMLFNQPFFGNIACRLKLKDVTDEGWCPTAATDGRHFFYNRDFVNSLNVSGSLTVAGSTLAASPFEAGSGTNSIQPIAESNTASGNKSSIGGGKAPTAGSLPTSVMRSAGLNLTKSLANEFAADQIRVNAICIGLIKSMQWVRRAGNKNPQELYDDMAKRIPLGRVGEAEEYADLVAFLCSKRAQFITGTSINLDGGVCPVI